MELVVGNVLDVVQAQLIVRYAELAQRQVLGHGEIFTIPAPTPRNSKGVAQ